MYFAVVAVDFHLLECITIVCVERFSREWMAFMLIGLQWLEVEELANGRTVCIWPKPCIEYLQQLNCTEITKVLVTV